MVIMVAGGTGAGSTRKVEYILISTFAEWLFVPTDLPADLGMTYKMIPFGRNKIAFADSMVDEVYLLDDTDDSYSSQPWPYIRINRGVIDAHYFPNCFS